MFVVFIQNKVLRYVLSSVYFVCVCVFLHENITTRNYKLIFIYLVEG